MIKLKLDLDVAYMVRDLLNVVVPFIEKIGDDAMMDLRNAQRIFNDIPPPRQHPSLNK